jgi:hypothetical protein
MPNYDAKFQVGGVTRGGPETLVDPASTATGAWFGSVRINSATTGALYPIATTRVASDSMLVWGLRFIGNAPSSFAVAPTFAATSLVAGAGFILRAITSTACASFKLDWELRNAVTHG